MYLSYGGPFSNGRHASIAVIPIEYVVSLASLRRGGIRIVEKTASFSATYPRLSTLLSKHPSTPGMAPPTKANAATHASTITPTTARTTRFIVRASARSRIGLK
jgi:hypothetical protein